MKHLKIGVRLAAAFGVVLALLASLSAIALARAGAMRDDMGVTRDIAIESSLAEQMRLAATQEALRVRNILMMPEDYDMAEQDRLLKADAQQYAEKVVDDEQFGARAREILSRVR